MQGARARWRIENETFNTLNNQGYHFEHHFGHGYQHLSVVVAVLRMLAFVVDQVQQLCGPLFQAAWAKWGSKRRLWEKRRALFDDYALDSMEHLFQALYYGFKKSAPILDIDSSSSISRPPEHRDAPIQTVESRRSGRSCSSRAARCVMDVGRASHLVHVGLPNRQTGSSNGPARHVETRFDITRI
jgi:hypothetical protein